MVAKRSQFVIAAVALLLTAVAGCAPPGPRLTPTQRAVFEAAAPILDLEPDANWTLQFNRLVNLGAPAFVVLSESPEMTARCAPDDLSVMLRTSLLRTLIDDPSAPRPTARVLETVGDLLHFELKVNGQSPGVPFLPPGRVPRAWHELYPAQLDLSIAEQIDADADRAAIVAWVRQRRATGGARVARPLTPRIESLWNALETRYADVWEYELRPAGVHCRLPVRLAAAQELPVPPLLRSITMDYNRARAASIWLGAAADDDILAGLIERVAHPSSIVAYNARFALRYCPDERIRRVIERYNHLPATSPEGESVRSDRPCNGVHGLCAGLNSRPPA